MVEATENGKNGVKGRGGRRPPGTGPRPAASLHEAAGRPSSRLTLERFIEAEGADARDGDGRTPLHMAAGVGGAGPIRILLARGADPAAADDSGNTPLHYAALLPSTLAARLLVAAGADPDARNECGISPRDVAQSPAMEAALEPRRPSARVSVPTGGPDFRWLRPHGSGMVEGTVGKKG